MVNFDPYVKGERPVGVDEEAQCYLNWNGQLAVDWTIFFAVVQYLNLMRHYAPLK